MLRSQDFDSQNLSCALTMGSNALSSNANRPMCLRNVVRNHVFDTAMMSREVNNAKGASPSSERPQRLCPSQLQKSHSAQTPSPHHTKIDLELLKSSRD